MQPHEYVRMAGIEQHNWWFVGKRDLVARLLHRFGPPRRPLLILDAGCGGGQTLVDLASFGTCIGADYDRSAVAFTTGRGIRCAVQADCQRPPFRRGRFDVVLLLDTLEHVPDDVRALGELGALLKPDGRLVITVPAHPWLFGVHDRALGHVRRYDEARLRRVVRRAGLRICHLTGYNTVLFPAVAVWRTLCRVVRPDARESDTAIEWPGWLNRLCCGLMRFENRLNLRGPSAPSVTMVAVLSP